MTNLVENHGFRNFCTDLWVLCLDEENEVKICTLHKNQPSTYDAILIYALQQFLLSIMYLFFAK